MDATHRLMVIHPCAKYVKPKKKLWVGHESAQTNGQTVRVLPIYPLNFVHGGYKNEIRVETVYGENEMHSVFDEKVQANQDRVYF